MGKQAEHEEEEIQDLAARKFKYSEWSHPQQRYLKREVTVGEVPAQETSRTFIDKFYAEHQATIAKVKEQFQRLKPKDIQVVRGQLSGEIDYEAAVRAMADIKSGIMPSDKVYTRTFKNRRSVAVSLLADISGSSGDFIAGTNLRPIDMIRRALAYYAIGLESIQDPYGIFLYSGEGKDRVDFYKLKDFSESLTPGVERRISSLRPQSNNRDGAGIRHATHLLLQQPYKTKILLYMTDFKPQDKGYEGAYAFEDTRKAIQEARLRGVYPCVLVTGNNLKEVEDNPNLMKGIRHVLVRNPESLPLTVPQVYLKLTR